MASGYQILRAFVKSIASSACDACDDPYEPYGDPHDSTYWCVGCKARKALAQAAKADCSCDDD